MTQWRVRGLRMWLYLLPLVLLVVDGVGPVLQLLHSGGYPLSAFGVTMLVLLVPVSSFNLVLAARTRVRLAPEGLEVRELGTRTYPWSDIAGVALDRGSGNRVITLTLVDGTTRRLPAPTTTRPTSVDPLMADAVAAIEARLPPGRTMVADDDFTSLDDLLQ